jgi:hypothetical protein
MLRLSSRSPSAFNARKVELLVVWLSRSIVTASWLWRSICIATRRGDAGNGQSCAGLAGAPVASARRHVPWWSARALAEVSGVSVFA